MGMSADDYIRTPVSKLLRQLMLTIRRRVGIFLAPVDIDYSHVAYLGRRLDALLYPVLVRAEHEYRLAALGQAQSVCRLGQPDIGEFNALDSVSRNCFVVLFVEISSAEDNILALPELYSISQPALALVERVVVRDIKNIEAYLHHLVAELRRGIEAGICTRCFLGVDYRLLIDYAYISRRNGRSDIFIGIGEVVAAGRRAGVRLIVYDPVNKIIAHGEDIHADGLAGVGSRALGGVFRLSAGGHRLLAGAEYEQSRQKSYNSGNGSLFHGILLLLSVERYSA